MTVFLTIEAGNDLIRNMGQPKRKQSKQRSRKRRGANRFKAPLLVKEPDGSFSRPHRVNPETGEYRGRQVLDLEV